MKYFFFVGTVAEFIKVMPVMREMSDREVPYEVIASGQNQIRERELLELAKAPSRFTYLHTKPIRQSPLSLFLWFCMTLIQGAVRFRRILRKARRDRATLIVHGDTISTVMGAALGRLYGARVAHVEAGLRSFNLLHPFPEEIDRLLASRMADVHFCPNDWAVNNLKDRRGTKVNTLANTLLDSLALAQSYPSQSPFLASLEGKKYFVCVLHRQENIYDKQMVTRFFETVRQISEKCACVFVLHAPTEAVLSQMNLLPQLSDNPQIILTKRLPYVEFIKLLSGAEFLLSDGGSNQEEASYLGIPCAIMREASERIEGLDGNVKLLGKNCAAIFDFFADYEKYRRPRTSPATRPSQLIVDALTQDA